MPLLTPPKTFLGFEPWTSWQAQFPYPLAGSNFTINLKLWFEKCTLKWFLPIELLYFRNCRNCNNIRLVPVLSASVVPAVDNFELLLLLVLVDNGEDSSAV